MSVSVTKLNAILNAPATNAAPAAAATPATNAEAPATVAKDGNQVKTDAQAAEPSDVDLDKALEAATAQVAAANAQLEKVKAAVEAHKHAHPAPAQPAETAAQPATPAKPAEPFTVTIKAGDTLSKIAKQYTGDPKAFKELLALNPQIKNPDRIYPGQTLKLPASWKKADPAAPANTATPAKPSDKPATTDAYGEAVAMGDTANYILANFDKVAGSDGMISKEDLQKNLPDGPGKDGFLKHFEHLKFASIDPGEAAWKNLTKNDVKEAFDVLQMGLEKKKPVNWQAYAEFSRRDDKIAKDFKAADKNHDGKLTGDEVPAAMKTSQFIEGGLTASEYNTEVVTGSDAETTKRLMDQMFTPTPEAKAPEQPKPQTPAPKKLEDIETIWV